MGHPLETPPQGANLTLTLGEDYPEIRASVKRICAGYPGAYWRALEEREAYPTEFVSALTKAGYLAALIPEEYGGAGLPLRTASSSRLEPCAKVATTSSMARRSGPRARCTPT